MVDFSRNVERAGDDDDDADNLNYKHVQSVFGDQTSKSQPELPILFKFAFVAVLEHPFCQRETDVQANRQKIYDHDGKYRFGTLGVEVNGRDFSIAGVNRHLLFPG